MMYGISDVSSEPSLYLGIKSSSRNNPITLFKMPLLAIKCTQALEEEYYKILSFSCSLYCLISFGNMAQQHLASRNSNRQTMIAGNESSRKNISQPRSKVIYNKLYTWTEKCAETRVGQFLIQMMDRTLKIVEETAKWSLPREENDAKLVRPLPWVLFFMLIIWLRTLRILLTMTALVVGNNAITPHLVVYFIQDQRCKLEVLRVHGSKSIKKKESESTANPENNPSIPVKLGKLLSRAICRPGYTNETPSSKVFVCKQSVQITENDSTSDNKICSPIVERSDPHLRVGELLEKYANANVDSDDDPDYVPSPRKLDRASSTSTSSSSDSDNESENEKSDMQKVRNLKTLQFILEVMLEYDPLKN
uniref:Uncharacterized protein n=1 Tax=Glossina brevipalpis TaxID=37001 RepID=A0A1A9WYX1_9MUSC